MPSATAARSSCASGASNLPSNTPQDQLEYLVVTEPIPSGTSVIESSIRGGFERFELAPGSITFYIGNRQHVEDIHYDVHGYLPGDTAPGRRSSATPTGRRSWP